MARARLRRALTRVLKDVRAGRATRAATDAISSSWQGWRRSSSRTFTSWKVEVKSAEEAPGDQIIWVDSTSRRIVKITATLTGWGGAVATMEPQK